MKCPSEGEILLWDIIRGNSNSKVSLSTGGSYSEVRFPGGGGGGSYTKKIAKCNKSPKGSLNT